MEMSSGTCIEMLSALRASLGVRSVLTPPTSEPACSDIEPLREHLPLLKLDASDFTWGVRG